MQVRKATDFMERWPGCLGRINEQGELKLKQLLFLIFIGLTVIAAPLNATTLYSNNFDTGEFIASGVTANLSGGALTGTSDKDLQEGTSTGGSVTLTLNGVGYAENILFDLETIGSWDPFGASDQDVFYFRLEDNTTTYFDYQWDFNQRYQNDYALNNYALNINSNITGALSISWYGDVTGDDEFWGLDNIVVNGTAGNNSPVPEPGTILLLGCGLIGLAGFGRKKFIK